MKNLRFAAALLGSALVVAACGSSTSGSTSSPRERNGLLTAVKNSNAPVCTSKVLLTGGCQGAFLTANPTYPNNVQSLLRNANKWDLSWTYLAASDLKLLSASNGKFVGADFSGSKMGGAFFTNVNFAHANFSNVVTAERSPQWMDRKITSATLSLSAFSYANFEDAQLVGADLSGSTFYGATFSGADLFGANVSNADFTGAILDNVKSGKVIGVPKHLPADWRLVSGFLIGPNADLSVPDNLRTKTASSSRSVSSCDLTAPSVRYSDTNLQLDAHGMALTGVSFAGLNLTGSNFSGAKIENTTFESANLTGVSFRAASLKRINFSSAAVGSVDFRGAQMNEIESGCTQPYAGLGAQSEQMPMFDSPWKLVVPDYKAQTRDMMTQRATGQFVSVKQGFIVGPGSNFSGKNITGLDLKGMDLHTANFDGVVTGNVGQISTQFDRPNRSFDGAILPTGYQVVNGWILGGHATLENVSLANLKVEPFDISQMQLNRVSSGGLVGNWGIPENFTLANGYLVGPTANLAGANLSQADLSNRDLSETDLTNANLSQANLTGVRAGGVISTGAKFPVGWANIGGYLIGPGANLTGLTLDTSNVKVGDFARLESSRVDLSNAILTDALITGFFGKPKVDINHAVVNDFSRSGSTFAIIGKDMRIPLGVMSGPSTAELEKYLPDSWAKMNGAWLGPQGFAKAITSRVTGSLTEKDVSAMNFSGLDLSGVTFDRVRGLDVVVSSRTKLPAKWQMSKALIPPVRSLAGTAPEKLDDSVLLGPTANLSELSLKNVDLRGVDLSNADLTNASGRFITVDAGTRFPIGWGVVGGILVGPSADLSNIPLVNLDLSGIDLSNAKMDKTVGIGLSNRNPIFPSGVSLLRQTLVGPHLDMICSDVTFDELDQLGLKDEQVNIVSKVREISPDLRPAWRNPCA